MVATKEQRAARAKKTAEIFTPHHLVNQMLDKLPAEVWEPGKTFVDPACGNGNMLIHVLYRKIAIHDHDPTEAVQSIFGVDIMRDNIRETRLRLLKVLSIFYDITEEDIVTVLKNVVWLNKKKFPQGSLDYNFSFSRTPDKTDVARYIKWVEEGVLEEVKLPVSDIESGRYPFEEADDTEGYE